MFENKPAWAPAPEESVLPLVTLALAALHIADASTVNAEMVSLCSWLEQKQVRNHQSTK